MIFFYHQKTKKKAFIFILNNNIFTKRGYMGITQLIKRGLQVNVRIRVLVISFLVFCSCTASEFNEGLNKVVSDIDSEISKLTKHETNQISYSFKKNEDSIATGTEKLLNKDNEKSENEKMIGEKSHTEVNERSIASEVSEQNSPSTAPSGEKKSFLQKLEEARIKSIESQSNAYSGIIVNANSDQTAKNFPITDILPPYDNNIDWSKNYPRVAVTVIKVPEGHASLSGSFNKSMDYLLQARVWTDKNTYYDTETFSWNFQEDQLYNFPLTDFWRWEGSFVSNSTGIKRTKGPAQPSHAFPNDRKHTKFFKHKYSPTVDYKMMCSLAYIAGIEPNSHDRRFWIVKFLEAK